MSVVSTEVVVHAEAWQLLPEQLRGAAVERLLATMRLPCCTVASTTALMAAMPEPHIDRPLRPFELGQLVGEWRAHWGGRRAA